MSATGPSSLDPKELVQRGYDAIAERHAAWTLGVRVEERERYTALLLSIATWLRPGGYLVASMGSRSTPGWLEDDWLGAPTYFSSFDAATNRRLVEEAGLRIVRAELETAEEFGRPTTFLWVVAQR